MMPGVASIAMSNCEPRRTRTPRTQPATPHVDQGHGRPIFVYAGPAIARRVPRFIDALRALTTTADRAAAIRQR